MPATAPDLATGQPAAPATLLKETGYLADGRRIVYYWFDKRPPERSAPFDSPAARAHAG